MVALQRWLWATDAGSLRSGERVPRSAACSRQYGYPSWRTRFLRTAIVHGRLYLTDQRLLFRRGSLRLFGPRGHRRGAVYVALWAVSASEATLLRPSRFLPPITLAVRLTEGPDLWFTVSDAARWQSAIGSARAGIQPHGAAEFA